MKLLTLAVVSACTLFVIGCSPKKEPKPVVSADDASVSATAAGGEAFPAGASAPASKTATALPVMGPAPEWKLKDPAGKVISSEEFKGKVVVLDFWATWCGPCRMEIPGYVDLYKKYGKDRLAIVGVSLDEGDTRKVRDFIAKFGITYPIVMGDEAVQQAFGGMEAIPTTFLIDREGRIRDKKVGALPAEVYERKIAAVLAES